MKLRSFFVNLSVSVHLNKPTKLGAFGPQHDHRVAWWHVVFYAAATAWLHLKKQKQRYSQCSLAFTQFYQLVSKKRPWTPGEENRTPHAAGAGNSRTEGLASCAGGVKKPFTPTCEQSRYPSSWFTKARPRSVATVSWSTQRGGWMGEFYARQPFVLEALLHKPPWQHGLPPACTGAEGRSLQLTCSNWSSSHSS